MNAAGRNLITCAWSPCAQHGTDLVLMMDRDTEYGVEFCADHAQRMLAINPLARQSEPEAESSLA